MAHFCQTQSTSTALQGYLCQRHPITKRLQWEIRCTETWMLVALMMYATLMGCRDPHTHTPKKKRFDILSVMGTLAAHPVFFLPVPCQDSTGPRPGVSAAQFPSCSMHIASQSLLSLATVYAGDER